MKVRCPVFPQSERRTLYVITDRGRQALANAPQEISVPATSIEARSLA
jgi:DNA-binding PadR family transcriptional regulator